MVTSNAHNASELYNYCRLYTFIIVPFDCDLTQHLNRPDARTRVRERGLSFSQSPKFYIFIISRNLRSKIKNRLPKSFAHMFTDSGTGLIFSRFLLRFELLIDLHGPLSPKSYRFFTLPSIAGIWVYGSTICLYIAPHIYSLMQGMCSSTPDSFYSSCNGLIKMGHFCRFSCVRVRVRHVLDALIRALIGAQTMMMVVARSLSFTFALFLSLPLVLILCVCY